MLQELRRLMKETAVYGLSTVVGRLLNFLLTPLYTHAMRPSEYGLVAIVFSYIAFVNVLYSHGMDFAFMRFFKERSGEEQRRVLFSTAFLSLTLWPLLISAAIWLAAAPLAVTIGLPVRLAEVVRYSAWIMAFDAVALVPFAYLRMRHHAGAYAGIKTFNIALNLALNYVFLVRLGLGVRGVFLASLVASIATLGALLPVIVGELRPRFDRALYGDLLRFALPVLPAGIASMMVQLIDRPILKALTDDATVGVYQANYRMGIFMMMVVSMFDAAWRPFFLQRAEEPDAPRVFARVMTYFAAGSAFLFAALTLFIPHVVALPLPRGRTLIHPSYWGGLAIVPVVTLGYLFNGLYINLLVPVTLAKRTERVAYATALGAAVNVGANLLWIPRWGMLGAAWATLAAYATMALSLYLMGRRLYAIPYERGRLSLVAGVTAAVLGGMRALHLTMRPDRAGARALLLLGFPAALLLTGFLDADERAALARRLRRR